ncbi:MAG TPA: TetR/AcrR family transcriptional regulator [Actinocrinis sp.]|jgi:AcrR family transcriptional regulator|uniref:TetR/AcrR family transcriptional regulator n=1 Tax=Actinocrinis sp. TaxID=1920516 RepID=UPI002DDCD12A|nr:TetR/AcrR family transcriptional regulator [Actinocrinis sp.]HEV3172332.1 TetR/AcrR family transcriptional regulator [Actinocrinis sp.]
MAEETKTRTPVRERLLAAADELFYAEGVNTVGIDQVIKKAGVAKASLYNTFGSKEELVRAYLRGRHTRTRERMARELEARYRTPRERLSGVFEVQGQIFAEPDFRGCAFMCASAESDTSEAVEKATEEYRLWMHSLFLDLAYAAGVPAPETLARQLVVIYDGAGVSAWLDRDPGVSTSAADIAKTLVDAAFAPTPTPDAGKQGTARRARAAEPEPAKPSV